MNDIPLFNIGEPHGTDLAGRHLVSITPISRVFVEAPIPSVVFAINPRGAMNTTDANPATPETAPLVNPAIPADFIPL
jgi:hypothetical protein